MSAADILTDKVDIASLCHQWMAAKQKETEIVEHRRRVEDALTAALSINAEVEGSATVKQSGFKVSITNRINRTVDGDLLQEIAAEHGLTGHLSTLFNWKPSIDMKAWKAADSSITAPLATAITAKPGRPTYKIETTEDKDHEA